MCIINWLVAKYYDHQFLKSIPDDYNDETNIPIVLDNKDYIIHIQGRENKTPQFHILDMNNNEICSISFVEPRYISISARYLTTKEAKELDTYMRSNYEGQNTTNWKLFCGFWECSCFNKEFRYDKINQPNYSLL